jgi:hypothetical protein
MHDCRRVPPDDGPSERRLGIAKPLASFPMAVEGEHDKSADAHLPPQGTPANSRCLFQRAAQEDCGSMFCRGNERLSLDWTYEPSSVFFFNPQLLLKNIRHAAADNAALVDRLTGEHGASAWEHRISSAVRVPDIWQRRICFLKDIGPLYVSMCVETAKDAAS